MKKTLTVIAAGAFGIAVLTSCAQGAPEQTDWEPQTLVTEVADAPVPDVSTSRVSLVPEEAETPSVQLAPEPEPVAIPAPEPVENTGPPNPIDPKQTAKNMHVPTKESGQVEFGTEGSDFDADIAQCEAQYGAAGQELELSDCINQTIVFHGEYE